MKALSGIIIGGIAGFFIAVLLLSAIGFTQGTNVSTNAMHSQIAKGFTCHDLTFDTTLTLHHIQTSSIEFMPQSPQVVFPAHIRTIQSVWSFQSGSDVDLVMIIYGPGTDGKSYMITFGRFSATAIEVVGWSKTVSWAIGQGPSTIIIKP